MTAGYLASCCTVGGHRPPLQLKNKAVMNMLDLILAALLLSTPATSQTPEERIGLRLIAVRTEAEAASLQPTNGRVAWPTPLSNVTLQRPLQRCRGCIGPGFALRKVSAGKTVTSQVVGGVKPFQVQRTE